MKTFLFHRISLVLASGLAFAAAAWFGRYLVDHLFNGRSQESGLVDSSETLPRAIFQDGSKNPAEESEAPPEPEKTVTTAEPADSIESRIEAEPFVFRAEKAEDEEEKEEEDLASIGPGDDPEPATLPLITPAAAQIDLLTDTAPVSQSLTSTGSAEEESAGNPAEPVTSTPAFAGSPSEPEDPEDPGNPDVPPGDDLPADDLVSGETELNISGGGEAAASAQLDAEANPQSAGFAASTDLTAGEEAEAEAVAEAAASTSLTTEIPPNPPTEPNGEEGQQAANTGRVIIGGRNSRGSAALYSNALGGSVSGLIGGLEVPDASSSSRVTYRPHVPTSQYERANLALPSATSGQTGIVPGTPGPGISASEIPVIPDISPASVTTIIPNGGSPTVSGGGGNSPLPISIPAAGGGSAGTGGSPGGSGGVSLPGLPSVNGGGLNLNLDIKVP